ncbi:hypothetical protein KQX54_004414 [Cotesia glomerata]|uniref:Ankyrin repeat protein n=1 Tax=Cotesia glomerata TaxID=32391 RepID=A0AAV7IWB0_COTGL|nr:hypothetical protein KQX54_004414 [Cotesia glomerata]
MEPENLHGLLQNAVYSKDFENVMILCMNDTIDINAFDESSKTALQSAVKTNQTKMLLIELGADPNAVDIFFSSTPLHVAAGNPEGKDIIRSLLLNGAKIDAVDNINMTPLKQASTCNPNHNITELLIKLGAKEEI